MDGLYATMTVQNPYTDEQTPSIRFWANKYKTKFNEDPTVFSVYGYMIINTFAIGSQQGRQEPDHEQLHQGHGQHDHSGRHVRCTGPNLHRPPSVWAAAHPACPRLPMASGRSCLST